MAILTYINGIPLYSTEQEALNFANENGLTGLHTHDYQGQTGYMGGVDHNNAITGFAQPETVQLIKQFLTNQDANNTIDRSFSELISKRNRVTIPEFFDYYNNLFYDIPRLGTLSHTELVNKSIEYLGNYQDPRDQEIRELNLRIDELTSQLNQQEFEEIEEQIANLTTKIIVTLDLKKGDHPNKFSKVRHKEIETHRLMFKDGINDENFYGSYKQFKTETIEIMTTAPTFTLFYDGRNKVENTDHGVKWVTGEDTNNPEPLVFTIPEGDNVYPVNLTLTGVKAHNMGYTTFMQENVDEANEAAIAAAAESEEGLNVGEQFASSIAAIGGR